MEQQYEEKYPTMEEFRAWMDTLPKDLRRVAELGLEDSRKPVTGARLADIMYFVDF